MKNRQMTTMRHTSPQAKAIALAVASCFGVQAPVHANPQNPTVIAGQAIVQQVGQTLTVTNTPGTIINWQQFNIDRGEITRFIQQSATSQVLNRVTGGDPSRILGMLQSNGRVLLINPNGVAFGAGAQVDVAGLLVSTLNLTNQDFASGRLKLNGNDGNGSVVNQGQIKTANGGEVIIVAPRIENSGLIQAPDGSILLAAGKRVEITELGSTDILVEIANSESHAVNLGSLMARAVTLSSGLVRQAGIIEATAATLGNGGKIVLRATHTLESTAESLTQASGSNGGQVQIEAGNSAHLSGQITASGDAGTGGQISATAPIMELNTANIRADGRDGGGQVSLGGEWQGGGTLKHADTLKVDTNSQISVDAQTNGNGGQLALWSNERTAFSGHASAQGGSASGHGGMIEISSEGQLVFHGTVNARARAANGESGLILFDPKFIEINSSGSDDVTLNAYGNNPSLTSVFKPVDLAGLLTGGNVTLQASTDITVSEWSDPSPTSNTLTLQAGRSILINEDITTQGANLVLSANDPGANPLYRDAGPGQINIANTIDTNGGSFSATLNSHAQGMSGITLQSSLHTTPSLAGAAGGSVTITAHNSQITTDSIKTQGGAGSFALDGGAGGNVSISILNGLAARTISLGGDIETMGGGGADGMPPTNGGAAGSIAIQVNSVGGDTIQFTKLDSNGGPGGNQLSTGPGGNGGAGAATTLRFLNANGTIVGSGGGEIHTGGGTGGTGTPPGTPGAGTTATLQSVVGNLTLNNVTHASGTTLQAQAGGKVLQGGGALRSNQLVALTAGAGIGDAGNFLVINGNSGSPSISFTGGSGPVYLAGTDAFSISANSTASGHIVVKSDGLLTLSGRLQSSSGNVTVVGAGIDNQFGASVLDAASGRWLVYSDDPGNVNENLNGLVRAFTQYDISYPTAPMGTGNGILYSLTPQTSTPSFIKPITKTYDGTNVAPVIAGDVTLTGVVPLQTVPGIDDSIVLDLGVATPIFASLHVGGGNSVTISSLTTIGTDGLGRPVYGYPLSTTAIATLSASITPASLILSADNSSKTFDGTTNATGPASIASGTLFGSDTLLGGSFVYDTPYVGTGKTVTVSGVDISDGNGGSNYTVSYAPSTNGTILADPANFAWVGPSTGGNWNTASHWNQGVLPVNNAVVNGSTLTGPLNFSAGSLHLQSLTLPAGLTVSGGSLTVGLSAVDVSTIAGAFLLSGGTFAIGNGNLTVPGDVTQTAGTFKLGYGTQLTGSLNLHGGMLIGSGTIQGNLSVGNATVSPGASPGTLNITGNLNLSPLSTIAIEVGGTVAGTEHDVVNVGGTANLDGTLNVDTWSGYEPTQGSTHKFISFANSTGSFAHTKLPASLSLALFPNHGLLQGQDIGSGSVGGSGGGSGGGSWTPGGGGGNEESSVIVATITSAMIDEDGTLQLVLGSPGNHNDGEQDEVLPTCP